jgi:protein O-GlcNAc transferase
LPTKSFSVTFQNPFDTNGALGLKPPEQLETEAVMVTYQAPPSIKAQRHDPAWIFDQAILAHERGLLADAERLYAKVLKKDGNHFGAVCRLGVVRLQQSRFHEAADLFRRAIRLDDKSADAHHYLAFVLTGVAEPDEAIRHYENALALRPDFAEAHNNFGHLFQRIGRFEDALLQFDKALALRPDYPEAYNNKGNVLHILGLAGEGTENYRKAIALKPDYAEAYWNLANALRATRDLNAAVASYEQALAIRANYPECHNGLANTLRLLHREEEAVAHYNKAIALKPSYFDALVNVAELLGQLDREEEALRYFDRALAIKHDSADALIKRGAMLDRNRRYKEAFASFEKAYAIDSNQHSALDGMTRAAAAACDWARREPLAVKLIAQVEQGGVADPLAILSSSDDAAVHLMCAQTFATNVVPQPSAYFWTGQTWRNSKIRLAYLAAGFRQHPTSYLTAELLEIHDRSEFEVFGFSVGPSEIRARIMRACDEFHHVRTKTDVEIAQQMNEMGIDIVIDRSGYTTDARPGIIACRPAPIQVNYIGFPGSLGIEWYDYVIADRIVLPFDQQEVYAEKIVHLPDCYLAHDTTEMKLPEPPTRQQVGLPEHGFVFCSFNNHHKINSTMFDIWMRLLLRIDGSVLWLLGDNGEAEENLRKEALVRGVDPTRLVFAPRVKLEDHLARHRHADLFLDTLPYGAHTTARDALWSGVLLVTCRGRTFAGRVAASVLDAAGLPELVTDNLEDYESLALRLASEPALLQHLRGKLERNRRDCAFFDSDRYRRSIEAAYRTMWQFWQDGQDPQSFAVALEGEHVAAQ